MTIKYRLSLNFRSCIPFEYLDALGRCQRCPPKTYSLNLNESLCKPCPEEKVNCSNNSMILKPGYWRFDYFDDDIFECSNNKDKCLGDGCLLGYIGPVCETCDIFGRLSDSFFFKLKDYNCARCGNISE
jgi:hypothetical protein